MAKERLNAHRRGYDRRWRKARALYLASHPLCVTCRKQGRTTAADVVDHIIPHRGDPTLFWDCEGNWAAVCKRCHDKKTATEERGGIQKGADVAGFPIASNHPWNR